MTAKLKLNKSQFKDSMIYYKDSLIGTAYWCGREGFVYPRVSLAREFKTKVLDGEEFVYSNGEWVSPQDSADIKGIVSQTTTAPDENLKLTDTGLLLRNDMLQEEHPPIMIFRHPSGRYVGISYKYAPLLYDLDLYQAGEAQGISGYTYGEWNLMVMPIRMGRSIEAILRAALAEKRNPDEAATIEDLAIDVMGLGDWPPYAPNSPEALAYRHAVLDVLDLLQAGTSDESKEVASGTAK